MSEQHTPTTWTPEWLKKTSPSVVVAMTEHRERTEERPAASPNVAHEVSR
jgi:hypothetical protein